MSKDKKKTSWLKIGLKIGLGLLALLILAAVLTIIFIDSILQKGIQTIGSTVTQCEVKVENIDLSFRKGELLIENFVIGNPAGYKTERAISFDKIFVSLAPTSLFSNCINISKIEILAPELTCEFGLGNSNLGTILDNINQMFPASSDEDEAKLKPASNPNQPGKKVEIDLIEIQDGKIGLSAKIMAGKALSIPLPAVSIKDIGKKEEKVGTVEATAVILRKMLVEAVKSVGSLGGSVTEGLKEIGGSVTEGLKDIGSSVTESLKGVGDSVTGSLKDSGSAVTGSLKDSGSAVTDNLKNTASSATDKLKDSGSAVTDKLKESSEAVTDEAKSLSKGIKGIKGLISGEAKK